MSLAQWLVDHGLIEVTAVLTSRELARVIEVGEALRDHLTAQEDQSVVEAAVRRTDALHGATLAVSFGLSGAAQLLPTADGIDGALAWLMAIVYRAKIDGTWLRMKTCHNQACRWVFYDASKNRSGTWCTMAICGSKRKARAHRLRKSGARNPGSSPTAP